MNAMVSRIGDPVAVADNSLSKRQVKPQLVERLEACLAELDGLGASLAAAHMSACLAALDDHSKMVEKVSRMD